MNAAAAESSPARPSKPIGWLDALALAHWPALLLLGLIGFAIPYDRPSPPTPPAALPPVEFVEIELGAPLPPSPAPAPSALAESLLLPDLLPPPPDAPAPTPVADPADVAFALPVEGPTVIVDAKSAARALPPPRPSDAIGLSLPVETLVYGQGEGRQPAPSYPRRAVRERQEGAVTVLFTVGPDGRVQDAAVSRACAWPLLNNEALRVIKNWWRFPKGKLRRLEVTIHFDLG